MKKYKICLFLFLATSLICLVIGVLARFQYEQQGKAQIETEAETMTGAEDQMAANRTFITHEPNRLTEEYYLVSEDGFLLVFLKDRTTIYLYTHMPLMDFPEKEQERLREGIWFSSMIEVLNYLESYTS